MIRATLAAVSLCLLSISSGCASRRSDPPPEIVYVREYIPLPSFCFRLPPVEIPDGATTDDVERIQHEALLTLRAQIRACRTTATSE